MQVELVALDLETTGLDPRQDAIIEIGAVRLREGNIVDEYEQLVDPGAPLPKVITEITGIRPEQLRGKPSITEVLPELIRFVGAAHVIGHNVDFDLEFLARQGALRDSPRVDTFELAAVLMPSATRYSLGNLAQELGIELNHAHRATDDARATALLYWQLWQKALQLPRTTLNEIVGAARDLKWSAEPVFRAAPAAQDLLAPSSPDRHSRGSDLFPAYEEQPELPAPADLPTPLDPDEIRAVLSDDSPLAAGLANFRERPQQQQMAQEVSAAFNEGRHLLIEAGAGVGKSLAYLLPAARLAQLNSRRVVISTHTINLQEQLLHKDLPLLQRVLAEPLRTAMLKGRGHYLCPRRLDVMRRRGPANLDELRVFCKVLVWLLESKSGDRSEISLRGPGDLFAWSRLSAEDPLCSLERCRTEMQGTCPFYKARKAAKSAHLLIVNHALLLADAASDHHLLPEHSALVLDEAHHLEQVASDVFGFRLDKQLLKRWIDDLGTADSGALGALLHTARGQLSSGDHQKLQEVVGIIGEAGKLLERHAGDLFNACGAFASDLDPSSKEYATRLRIVPRLREHDRFDLLVEHWQTLAPFFFEISDALHRLKAWLGRVKPDDETELDEHLARLNNVMRWFVETRAQLEAFFEKPQGNSIYWLEVSRERSSLHAAPLHVGPLVEEHLWNRLETAVLTSTTLRSGPDFSFLRERLNADGVRAVAVGSPFNYRASTLVYVPRDIPEPAQYERYQAAVERGLIELAAALGGRTLALFTSYRQLRQTTQAISPRLALGGIEVFSQSSGGSQAALLRGFRQSEKAVLLGTNSFREGIDIPGDDLSALVIVRLPFTVPTDPVFDARSRTFVNPFDDYAVPEAILRFRQGFGRLIRSHEDRGVVAIFDRRVISKRYGRLFLASLPDCTHKTGRLADLPDAAQRWLQRRV